MSSNPILAVIIVGAGLTALVQSSSATIGILQEFYQQDLIKLAKTQHNPCVTR